MFKKPFSFEGRIRRTEYVISLIIYLLIAKILNVDEIVQDGNLFIIVLAYIPISWFLLAQGTKRCHDRGNSGWYQIIPFYCLWMLFAESEIGTNKYGKNPKDEYINKTYDDTESKPDDIDSSENCNRNDKRESSINPYVSNETVNTQINENEVVTKTFVPKKKPVRKSQS